MGRDTEDSLAVVVFREEGVWESGLLPEKVTDDLDGLVSSPTSSSSPYGSGARRSDCCCPT
jgi:hypothetical protein